MSTEQLEVSDHQSLKLLQREIIQRDHTEARLEREVAELSAANKELRRKLSESTSALVQRRQEDRQAEGSAEQKADELTAIVGQLQRKVAESSKAIERSKKKIDALTSVNRQLQDKTTQITSANEQLQQQVTASTKAGEHATQKMAGLTAANEQLQDRIAKLTTANGQLLRQVAESKKVWEGSRQTIADLTAANEQLRNEISRAQEFPEEKVDSKAIDEQLGQDISKTDDARKRSDQKMTELTAAHEQLQPEVPRRKKADRAERHKRLKAGRFRAGKMVSLSKVNLKAKSPAQQVRELAEEIVDSSVQTGTSAGPDAKREAILQACDYLDADNVSMAINALERFIASVAAWQNHSGEIPQKEEAEDMMAAARQIIDQLTAG